MYVEKDLGKVRRKQKMITDYRAMKDKQMWKWQNPLSRFYSRYATANSITLYVQFLYFYLKKLNA